MISINIIEICVLSVFFTFLAFYFNIYGEKHVIAFIINHVIALFIALLISGIFYYIFNKYFH